MSNSQNTLTYRKYPSTTAMQCFETAARHLSFTSAAQELHMTQSAVSKQVAQLEELINKPLFYRTSQKISLTPAGKRYYLEVVEILKHIEIATTTLMSHSDNMEILKITSHPTFCARWLIPTLAGFRDTYPNINIEMREQTGPFFSADNDVDIAFLYGDGVWAGMESIKLFDEYLIAVCTPSYLDSKVADDGQMDKLTLLQLSSRPSAWYEYFKQQSISIDGTFVGPKFDSFYSCISAALLDYGVALVPLRLVEPEIQSGALVKAWPYASKSISAYYMSYPLSLGNSHKVKTVVNWVLEYLKKNNKVSKEVFNK